MLTLLGRPCLAFGGREGPLKLSHFIAKDGGQLLFSLIDDESRKVALMVASSNQLS